jgi:hypothetical protein
MAAENLFGQSWSQEASREQVLVSLEASNRLSPRIEAMVEWTAEKVHGLTAGWDIVDTVDLSFAATKEETVKTGLTMADYLAQFSKNIH